MKRLRFLFGFFLVLSPFTKVNAQTTVWIVRHAEKDTSMPSNPNPGLTEVGLQRAEDLSAMLSDKKIAAVYATPYRRANLTGAPLAQSAGFSVRDYDPAKPVALVEEVLAQFRGRSVLIVGHSNTVLELIEAFGAKRSLATMSDNDYDFLFKVTLAADSKITVEVLQFGKSHRSSR